MHYNNRYGGSGGALPTAAPSSLRLMLNGGTPGGDSLPASLGPRRVPASTGFAAAGAGAAPSALRLTVSACQQAPVVSLPSVHTPERGGGAGAGGAGGGAEAPGGKSEAEARVLARMHLSAIQRIDEMRRGDKASRENDDSTLGVPGHVRPLRSS